MHREHPLRIIRYSIKNIWLLVLPLLRLVYTYHFSPELLMSWLRGAWFDLLILAAILGFGWLNWFFREFTVEDGQLFIRDGILYTRRRYVPGCNLTSLTIRQPPWLRPFRAAYLRADTAAGILGTADIRLLIRLSDAEMFRRALPHLRKGKRHNIHYKVDLWRVLLFSVLFSSSFYGSVYLATFWFQGGRVVRDIIQDLRLTERLSTLSEEVAGHLLGIPPAAVTLGLMILTSWMLSLLANLLRYFGFFVESDKRMMYIHSGLLMRRRILLHTHRINYLDIRQNLLMKLFHLHTVAVNCPGYGKERGSIPVCLPILTGDEADFTVLPRMFPGVRMTDNTLRPPATSWWPYVSLPVFAAAAILPAAQIAKHLLPTVDDLFSFLQIMLLIPIGWKFIIQNVAFRTSGLSIRDGRLCLRYCRFTTFHTILADTDCVVKVRINRWFWQYWSGKCSVTIYLQSETVRRFTLWSLNYEQTRALLGEFLIPSDPDSHDKKTPQT